MSDDNNANTPADNGGTPPPALGTTAQLSCPSCGNRLYARTNHPVNVNNQPEFSAIVIVHEKPVICGKCDSFYAPAAIVQPSPSGMLITMALMQIPKPQPESDIVVAKSMPPPPGRMQ